MSDLIVNLVKTAREAWLDGFAIISDRVNEILAMVSPNLCIDAPERKPKVLLSSVRQRLLNAITGLRAHLVDLPDDYDLCRYLWHIADEGYIGSSSNVDEELESYVERMTRWIDPIPPAQKIDWTIANWREFVVLKAEAHRKKWMQRFSLLEKAAKEQAGQSAKIPPEHRTKPLTYKRAAELLGRGKSKDAAEWLSKSVADGAYRCEHISRQTHVFDKTQFPSKAQEFL